MHLPNPDGRRTRGRRPSSLSEVRPLSPFAGTVTAIACARGTPPHHPGGHRLRGRRNGWNSARIARALRIHRATLFRRLSHAGLTLRSLKESQESQESQESRDRRATGATLGAGFVP